MTRRVGVRALRAAVAVCVLAVGLATATGPTAAAQPISSAADCAREFNFAQDPVPVAKTIDGRTVLATVQWGYNAEHHLCYLVLDDNALSTLRANADDISATPPAHDPAAAARCERAYNPKRGFAAEPVPVAKTADGRTVLATVQWGYNADHNLCYLVLDYQAIISLRAAHNTAYVAVSAGGGYTCAIRADSTLVCWGAHADDPPDGYYTDVSAGGGHSCAIKTDQTIDCWGWNDYGQADPPDGQYTAIAAGESHSCAIRTAQTIDCWGGHDEYGQAESPTGWYTAVSAGDFHSCAIQTDATITCWGFNYDGRAGQPLGPYEVPTGHFAAVSAGGFHSCGVRAHQNIACWGQNSFGEADQLGGRFTTVTAGYRHSCGIRADQTIACWGQNTFGEADPPSGQFTAISAGGDHSCGIRADQTIACWGNNLYGQADPPGG